MSDTGEVHAVRTKRNAGGVPKLRIGTRTPHSTNETLIHDSCLSPIGRYSAVLPVRHHQSMRRGAIAQSAGRIYAVQGSQRRDSGVWRMDQAVNAWSVRIRRGISAPGSGRTPHERCTVAPHHRAPPMPKALGRHRCCFTPARRVHRPCDSGAHCTRPLPPAHSETSVDTGYPCAPKAPTHARRVDVRTGLHWPCA